MSAQSLMFQSGVWLLLTAAAASAQTPAPGAPPAPSNQRYDWLARQPTGLLIPLYLYPANIHTNAVYNRLIDLKLSHPAIPVWVILNPASGPGQQVDANYVKAIDRLHGAGVVVLGYVSTEYGRRAIADVERDIDRWGRLYPKINGVFFDEMQYDDTDVAVERQVTLRDYAASKGYWPTVANPGAATPERFFARQAADVIIVHEGRDVPSEAALRGDYFGGYADYPPFTRCVLLHSQAKFDAEGFARIKKYARWVYVTDDVFDDQRPLDTNPWDSLSAYLEQMFAALK